MTDNMKKFGDSINRLIAGKDLSREETRDFFIQILDDEQSEIHQGAFLSAITAKGPTAKEIAGAWEAIYAHDTVKVYPDIDRPVIDNCGTGMDGFKTFNISTGASIIAAAGGACVARHGARALTSKCGTVDVCEALGVDVECNASIVKNSIEKADIGLFNGMSPEVHPKALFRILSRMSFGSILNVAGSLANPVDPEFGVRGVYAKEMVAPIMNTMKEKGFKRAMVFHGCCGNGAGGIDELSPVGESYISELRQDGQVKEYTLHPKDVRLANSFSAADIAGGSDLKEEALKLLRVFNGNGAVAVYETLCLNAAPVLYISGIVDDLKQGVEKSREIIDSGLAMQKLRQWVKVQNRNADAGTSRIESLLEQIN